MSSAAAAACSAARLLAAAFLSVPSDAYRLVVRAAGWSLTIGPCAQAASVAAVSAAANRCSTRLTAAGEPSGARRTIRLALVLMQQNLLIEDTLALPHRKSRAPGEGASMA